MEELKDLRYLNASLNVKLEKVENELEFAEDMVLRLSVASSHKANRIKELENLLIKVLVYRRSRLKDNLVTEIGRVLRNEENK